MKYLLAGAVALLVFGGVFLIASNSHQVVLEAPQGAANNSAAAVADKSAATSNSGLKSAAAERYADIENQKPLPNPPPVIKGIYATGYSAGSPKKVDYLINIIKRTELNTIVIDIKDYSGYVLYDIQDPFVLRYKTKAVQIPRINEVIKKFHNEGIYVIARQTMFQDPALAEARPDLALKNISGLGTSTPVSAAPVWKDSKGLSWMDPASQEVWDYNIAIAKDAAARGFDEINFDYVRFASDGSLGHIGFPFYNPRTTLKKTAISNFFKYLREKMASTTISADLFGLTTVNNDDLGIGQALDIAAPYFDYVSPMTYPSHYASGFIGYKNPASFPYEVVRYSMEKAVEKLMTKPVYGIATGANGATSTVLTAAPAPKYRAKLRPWLQDFNLGAIYDARKVRAQITAVDEIVKKTPLYDGWLLWNAANNYTETALNQSE